jgi:hypothetical protein
MWKSTFRLDDRVGMGLTFGSTMQNLRPREREPTGPTEPFFTAPARKGLSLIK